MRPQGPQNAEYALKVLEAYRAYHGEPLTYYQLAYRILLTLEPDVDFIGPNRQITQKKINRLKQWLEKHMNWLAQRV